MAVQTQPPQVRSSGAFLFRLLPMPCLECGAEMRLVQVTKDTTMQFWAAPSSVKVVRDHAIQSVVTCLHPVGVTPVEGHMALRIGRRKFTAHSIAIFSFSSLFFSTPPNEFFQIQADLSPVSTWLCYFRRTSAPGRGRPAHHAVWRLPSRRASSQASPAIQMRCRRSLPCRGRKPRARCS
jgi:hypothetical protein